MLGLAACSHQPRPARGPEPTEDRYRFLPPATELTCHTLDTSESASPCSRSSLGGCLRDARDRGSDRSGRALRVLSKACRDQGPCACTLYGSALSNSERADEQLDGLAHLEKACAAGVLNACDEGLLLVYLCAETSAPYCETLHRAGVVPPPEPVWKDSTAPATELGCYEAPVDVRYEGNGERRLLTVCVSSERMWSRLDAWDVRSIRWQERKDGEFRAVVDGARAVLTVARGSSTIRVAGHDDTPLGRVQGARAERLMHDIQKLPTTQAMCEAANACERARERALLALGHDLAEEESDTGDTFASCREALNAAREAVMALDPERAARECVLP